MSNPPDYDRIAKVNVTIRAELGRTTLRLREVESLAPGTVVTLDRLAGEPVELRCRGQVIATGEVVIQDEAFAIRVTEILQYRGIQPAIPNRIHRRRK